MPKNQVSGRCESNPNPTVLLCCCQPSAQEWKEYCYAIWASCSLFNKRRQFSVYQSTASGDWFAGVNLATFATGFALTARIIEVEEALAHETYTREAQRCSRGIWTEWLTWKLQNGKRPVCATMQRIFQRRRIRTLRLVWALMAALALSLAVCSAIFTVWTLRQTRDLSRSFQTLQERLEQVNAMARSLAFLSLKCMTDACMHSQAHLSSSSH